MISVRVKAGRRYIYPGGAEIDLSLSLEEFVSLRERVAQVFPTIYEDTGSLFGVTASGLGMEIAYYLGLVEGKKAASAFFPRWAKKMVLNVPFEGPVWVHTLIKDVRVVRPKRVTLKGCVEDHMVL